MPDHDPPTIGLVVPDPQPRDHDNVIALNARSRTEGPGSRQAIPVIRTGPELTADARRVLDDYLGELVALLGGDQAIGRPFYELTDLETGRAHLSISVTFGIAGLNAFAAALCRKPEGGDRG